MKTRISRSILDYIYSLSPEELLAEGWPIDVVNMLSSHDSQDRKVMENLADHIIRSKISDDVVHLKIDLEALKKQAHCRIQQERESRILEERFLRLGASNSCMLALFGMTKEESHTRRKLYGCIDSTQRGRPNNRHLDEIAYLWHKLQRLGVDKRDAILEINKRIGCPISVIWNAIKKTEAELQQSSDTPAARENA